MPQYEVLAEVASTVRGVVARALQASGLDDLEVTCEPPTPHRLPDPPAVVVHVVSVSVSWLYRQRTPRRYLRVVDDDASTPGPDGATPRAAGRAGRPAAEGAAGAARKGPPAREVIEVDAPALLDLRIAVSAHATAALDALRLLGLAMRALFERRVVRGALLDAEVFGPDNAIQIRPEFDVPWSEALAYWRALGQAPAPVAFYRVRCRLESERPPYRRRAAARAALRDAPRRPAPSQTPGVRP